MRQEFHKFVGTNLNRYGVNIAMITINTINSAKLIKFLLSALYLKNLPSPIQCFKVINKLLLIIALNVGKSVSIHDYFYLFFCK
jgi:hypothetical protein